MSDNLSNGDELKTLLPLLLFQKSTVEDMKALMQNKLLRKTGSGGNIMPLFHLRKPTHACNLIIPSMKK